MEDNKCIGPVCNVLSCEIHPCRVCKKTTCAAHVSNRCSICDDGECPSRKYGKEEVPEEEEKH